MLFTCNWSKINQNSQSKTSKKYNPVKAINKLKKSQLTKSTYQFKPTDRDKINK